MSSKISKDLKNSFQSGVIPTQGDFEDLIDFSKEARNAIGFDPDKEVFNPSPSDGFEEGESGQLKIKIDKSKGLELDEDNGLYINHGKSLKTEDGLLDVHTSGVITTDDSGVKLNLNPDGSGLYDVNGLAVNCGNGLEIKDGKLFPKVGDGLTIGNDGIEVNAELIGFMNLYDCKRYFITEGIDLKSKSLICTIYYNYPGKPGVAVFKSRAFPVGNSTGTCTLSGATRRYPSTLDIEEIRSINITINDRHEYIYVFELDRSCIHNITIRLVDSVNNSV